MSYQTSDFHGEWKNKNVSNGKMRIDFYIKNKDGEVVCIVTKEIQTNANLTAIATTEIQTYVNYMNLPPPLSIPDDGIPPEGD